MLIGANTESAYRMAGLDAEAECARLPRRRTGREVEDEEPVVVTGDEPETETAEASGDVPERSTSSYPRRRAAHCGSVSRSTLWAAIHRKSSGTP